MVRQGYRKLIFSPVQTDFKFVKPIQFVSLHKTLFFFGEKTHFADHILAQLSGLVKCQTVYCP